MKVQILIISYLKDKPWLEWCLKSISKFATGFSGTTVAVPENEYDQFKDLFLPPETYILTYDRVTDSAKWHLNAQLEKCFADHYCANADFVLHTDSDCIFTEPVTPEDYFENGKPVMLIESYSRIKDSPWKAVTDAVLKLNCPFETMRRHPQVNPRGVYEDFRAHVELVQGMEFDAFVLSRKADFPWGFSEHNAIGSFSLQDPKWQKAYHWIDLAKAPAPKEKIKQFWSYGPIDKFQGSPHDKNGCVPLDVIRKILA